MGSTDAIVFEQPRELNRFACPAVPWTWARFWVVVRLLVPGFVFCLIAIAESVQLRGVAFMPALFGFMILIPLIIVFAVFADRLQNSGKRTLKLSGKGLVAKPCPLRRIAWRQLIGVQFEPAGLDGELTKVTLRYPGRSRDFPRQWPIVFANAAESAALLSELRIRRGAGLGSFAIDVSDVPIPQRKPMPLRVGWLWAYCFGMFLILDGLPMLMFGIKPPNHHLRGGAMGVIVWIGELAGYEDSRRLLIEMGAMLSIAGGGIMAAAIGAQKKRIKAYRAETQSGDESPVPKPPA